MPIPRRRTPAVTMAKIGLGNSAVWPVTARTSSSETLVSASGSEFRALINESPSDSVNLMNHTGYRENDSNGDRKSAHTRENIQGIFYDAINSKVCEVPYTQLKLLVTFSDSIVQKKKFKREDSF
jgi:hypothetical protein